MELRPRVEELLGRKVPNPQLYTDTSNVLKPVSGDVLEMEGRRFVLKGMATEGRFGIDDQPKYWVRTALDWEDGSPKVIKLVFYEDFDLPVGPVYLHCFRSPAKESRILEIVRGNHRFMQGHALKDRAGNPVRVLDQIRGQPLHDWLRSLPMNHQQYFEGPMRWVLGRLLPCCRAIGWLHEKGERHGDIRRDHLLMDHDSGDWRWIDFDYDYEFYESRFGFDIFGLGNVILFAVAKGEPSAHAYAKSHPEKLDSLEPGDFSPVIHQRLFNLKKIYPYLPEELNRVLMHFAASTNIYYDEVKELADDLEQAIECLPRPSQEEWP